MRTAFNAAQIDTNAHTIQTRYPALAVISNHDGTTIRSTISPHAANLLTAFPSNCRPPASYFPTRFIGA